VTNIFVGNLSYQATQADLQAAFETYGSVERVNLITDRDTGQPRGFAFVEMSDADAAQRAISNLNGAELHGRAMNVNEARPKPTGGGSGGGFGARRNSSGGGGRGGNRRREPRW
jgi:RNA recognition motif-containing protein